MPFDTVLGLPTHILVIHAVVVLVPLAAVCAVAVALVPRWRSRYGGPVALLSTAAFLAVPVAVQSGQRFLDRLDSIGGVTPAVERHADLGEAATFWVLPLWLLTLALVVLDRRRRSTTNIPVTAETGARAAGGSPGSWNSDEGRPPLGRGSTAPSRQGPAVTAVAALTVVAALVAAAQVARIGDAGSRAVWEQLVENSDRG